MAEIAIPMAALGIMYILSNDKKKVKEYATLLYNQALLIEGMKLEDPVEFSNLMVSLMIDANK